MGHDIWAWFDLLRGPYFRARYIKKDQVHTRDQNGTYLTFLAFFSSLDFLVLKQVITWFLSMICMPPSLLFMKDNNSSQDTRNHFLERALKIFSKLCRSGEIRNQGYSLPPSTPVPYLHSWGFQESSPILTLAWSTPKSVSPNKQVGKVFLNSYFMMHAYLTICVFPFVFVMESITCLNL